MSTVSDAISRVRNVLKTVKEDPFMTDRFIYSLIMKYGKTLIYRDSKSRNIFKNSGLFKAIPCVDLMEVSSVEACCTSIQTKCTFMRSRYPLPAMLKLAEGGVIRTVTSLDYSERLNKVEPSTFINISKSTDFKYNTSGYFWIIDDYLFIPNRTWEGVRIEALWEEDISDLLCNIGDDQKCGTEQERVIAIPEYLFTEIENMIRQELFATMQIPQEGPDDQQSLMR